ncbi:MAG: cupin domain-containing protein, partial [Alteromonas macleodii]|nr:cupin domain-containing protein [Alteromonas macleodii]
MSVLSERLVRYEELIPCRNAFIDTRSPGSDQKENFTIIGPGVAENPDQHVHIAIPHGFNIGGARQP